MYMVAPLGLGLVVEHKPIEFSWSLVNRTLVVLFAVAITHSVQMCN